MLVGDTHGTYTSLTDTQPMFYTGSIAYQPLPRLISAFLVCRLDMKPGVSGPPYAQAIWSKAIFGVAMLFVGDPTPESGAER